MNRPAEQYIRLSLSEIEALGTKAARAAGFDWGLAEEAGWATARLAGLGLEAPELLLRLLEAPRGATPRPGAGHWGTGHWGTGHWGAGGQPLCPILAGAAMADHAGLPDGPLAGPLLLAPLPCPAFLVPFAARAAARRGTPVLVTAGAAAALAPLPPAPLLLDPGPWNDGGRQAVTIAVAREVRALPTPPPPRQDIPLSIWARLDALALQTTVPPSTRSRAGAGASGDDRD